MNTVSMAINKCRACVLIALVVGLAITSISARAISLSAVTISNNSQYEIRGLYLSHAGSDDWGADQLNGAVINPGGSYTLSFTWDQPTVKIVAEDKDGCFFSTTMDATTSSTWDITNASARNCGSQ